MRYELVGRITAREELRADGEQATIYEREWVRVKLVSGDKSLSLAGPAGTAMDLPDVACEAHRAQIEAAIAEGKLKRTPA